MNVIRKRRSWPVAALLLAGLAVGPTSAAPAQDRAALLAGMKACLDEADPGRRLACFERLAEGALGDTRAGPATAAEAAPPAMTAPPALPAAAAVAPTAPPSAPSAPTVEPATSAAPASDEVRARYGLRESKRDEPKALEITIIAARPDREGHWIFESADGQQWEQTDRIRVRLTRLPVPARIEKSFFGSYFLDLEGVAADIRVRRRK